MPAAKGKPNKKAVVAAPVELKVAFPWERLPGESLQAYARFVRYRNTPAADRSMRKVGVAPSLAFRWAKEHRWVDRVDEYEAWVASLGDSVSVAASLAHRGKAARFADRALDKATLAVENLNPAKLSSGAIVELARGATDIGRAALGLSDAKPNQTAAGVTVGVGVVWGGESPAWLPSAKPNETQVERNSDGRVKVLANGVPGPLPVHAGSPAEGQIVDVTPEDPKK